jgi:hypothetical protein
MIKIMTLQAFPKYIKLIKLGHHPSSMGFGEQVKRGDINQFNSRFRLAKSFQRIHLDGYSPETFYGYDAFLKVFFDSFYFREISRDYLPQIGCA